MTRHHQTHHQRYMARRHPTSPVAMCRAANTRRKLAGVQNEVALTVQQQNELAQRTDLLKGNVGINHNPIDTPIEVIAMTPGANGRPVDSSYEVDDHININRLRPKT